MIQEKVELNTILDHGEFRRPGPPIEALGKVALVHLLLLQPALQLGGALGADHDQGCLRSRTSASAL